MSQSETLTTHRNRVSAPMLRLAARCKMGQNWSRGFTLPKRASPVSGSTLLGLNDPEQEDR